jgi:hypothetical protein
MRTNAAGQLAPVRARLVVVVITKPTPDLQRQRRPGELSTLARQLRPPTRIDSRR